MLRRALLASAFKRGEAAVGTFVLPFASPGVTLWWASAVARVSMGSKQLTDRRAAGGASRCADLQAIAERLSRVSASNA